MKTPKIAPTTLPNNPTDDTALPPAASARLGVEVADPVVPVLVAAPPGTTVVLKMVD